MERKIGRSKKDGTTKVEPKRRIRPRATAKKKRAGKSQLGDLPRVSVRATSKDYPGVKAGSMSARRAARRTPEAALYGPGGFARRWTADAGITLHRDRKTAIRRRVTSDIIGPKLVNV